MKFTGALSTLLVVLPFVLQATAAPAPAPEPFNFQGIASKASGFFGGGRNRNGGATSAASAATASSTAATAANSTASTGAAGTANAGNGTAAAGSGNPQTSLTLDPSVIGPNIALDGQAVQEAGQVASATSVNNFINSCIGKTITNGQQIATGSCNPIPMGDLPAQQNQPSCKFASPPNLSNIPQANTPFNIVMNIQGMQTGAFTNPNTNYFGAPQALNAGGQIVGHSHAVIQSIPSITSGAPQDPTVFDFFQGINGAAQNGQLTITVAKGLPEGTYRLSSINTAANHQPVVGPKAQHGTYDDMVYFTVGQAAANAAAAAVAGGASNATAAAAAPPAAAPPAAGNATAAAPPPAAPPAAANATATGGNAGANKGSRGKGKGRGRRSIIAPQY
jgi:hypothetical protein